MTTALNTTQQINDVGMAHKLTQLISPAGNAVNVADIVAGNVASGTFATDVAVTGNISATGTGNFTGTLTTGNVSNGGTLTQTGLATFTVMPRLPANAATPAGTVLGNATQLVVGFTTLADAVANAGVKLPATPAAGTWCVVNNQSGNTTKVYPDASATINA